jgi:hypothetical protein
VSLAATTGPGTTLAERIRSFRGLQPRLPSQRLFGELATIHAEPEVLEKWLASHKLSLASVQLAPAFERIILATGH